MQDDERLALYTKRLEYWIASTGKTQKELCVLTAGFAFGNRKNGAPITESAFSRTIRTLPFRVEGKFNLYRILGALYLLGVIHDEREARDFLDLCDIGEAPEHSTWNDIWQTIEAGARQYRDNHQKRPHTSPKSSATQVDLPQSIAAQSRGFAHKYRVLILLGMVVLIGVVGGVLTLLWNPRELPPLPTSTPLPSTASIEPKARFGTVVSVEPGSICSESILQVQINLNASTRDFDSNDVIGLVASDSNGIIVVSRLLHFYSPSSYEQTLAVNLNHINPITQRPLTIRLYDTSYAPEVTPGVSSMDAFRFITDTGLLLAEIIVDPADYLSNCSDLPIGN